MAEAIDSGPDWPKEKPVAIWKLASGEAEVESEIALAYLLLNEQIILNRHWWEKDWPVEAKTAISVAVICNDVFAWGCADAERLPYDEVETLYRMWRKDPAWGAAVWCMVRRNQMPQPPVERRIRDAGIWDLDALKLGPNYQDAETKAYLAQLLAPSGTTR